MNRSLGAALALLALPLVMAGQANAQYTETATGSLGVSITIEAECTVSNVVPVAFDPTGILSEDVDAEGSVDVTCTTGTAYDIALGVASGTASERQMTGADGTITYALYPDNTYGTAWGDEVGEDTKSSTGTGSAQTHTIYGRIEDQATPAPGSYSDTVAITVHY